MQSTTLEHPAPFAASHDAPRPASLLSRRAVWRDALIAWLAQHVALVAVTWLAIRPTNLRQWIEPWTNWDGQPFAQIASNGYLHPAQAAFYPLYPLLERLLSPLTAGNAAFAGLLVANVAALAAFALLRALAERELSVGAARRALVYLLVFPTAFFLVAAYSESLFLALSLGAFLALRSHRWPLAGALIALATLTRPLGILLLFAVAAEVWTTYPRLRHALGHPLTTLRSLREPSVSANSAPAAVKSSPSDSVFSVSSVVKLCSAFALPILALAGYAGYLAARFGSPFTFLSAEGGTWQRGATWPWQSVAGVIGALFTDTAAHRFHALVDLALLALVLALAVWMARRLPLAYTLYTWATLALILLIPSHLHEWSALTSDKRFYLALFPLFMLLASVPRLRWIEPFAVIGASLLQIVLAVIFLRGGWVA